MRALVTHAYSSDNKGDATLLSVLLSDLRRAFKNTRITVLTTERIKDGEHFEQAKLQHSFMYHAFNRFRLKPAKLLYSLFIVTSTLTWAYALKYFNISLPLPPSIKKVSEHYKNADLITGVGGGYLRSKPSFVSSVELILLLHPLKIASILSRPTVLYTQSLGPFSNKFQKYLAAKMLKQVELIIVREDISVELLRQMGVSRNVVRSADSAFAFQGNNPVNWRSKLNLPENQQVVGITVRSWLNSSKQTEYEKSIAALADYLAKKGYGVVFIPQVTCKHENDDDREVATRVNGYMQHKNEAVFITEKIDHHEIQSLYGELDYLVGTRFHSVIFALKSYVPALAIEYEHKTSGIMRDLGLEKWVIDINDILPSKLIEGMDLLVNSRGRYTKRLKKVIPPYVKQAQSTYRYLQEVIRNRTGAR